MENTSYNHGSNLLAVDEEEAVEKTFHTKNMVCSGYQREMGMMQGIGVSKSNGAFLSMVYIVQVAVFPEIQRPSESSPIEWC